MTRICIRDQGSVEAGPLRIRLMDHDLRDFIRSRIRRDIADGLVTDGVVTRFPPEPNGYLHIGHAKSICLNFGVAAEHGGATYLRFDDTNPRTESSEFVEAIQQDIKWLGFDWGDRLTFASDYFEQLYGFAEELISRGKAYVCSLPSEEIRATRGTLVKPGVDSPFRDRPKEESLDLFRRMRKGEFGNGKHVLRAKIDMSSPNINMRDPVLYRILHAAHHRTGCSWCIYPMYDFTHCICDALEGITHSLCTLEFEDHRPLYDWVLDNININFHPPQIEFSRLVLDYNVMSKRILTSLIRLGHVDGWDDPRLPTLSGLRRRGIPAQAIRDFCQRIGVTKAAHSVEVELLDFCARSVLERSTRRGMAVLDPVRVLVVNFEGEPEQLNAPWHPKRGELGSRKVLFGRELFIERSDFAFDPPRKFRRLSPGQMVRLRYAYIIRCDEVVCGAEGRVEELRVTYFPNSRSGSDVSGLKPKGVIHFVAATNAVPATFRLVDKLFKAKAPSADAFDEQLHPDSLRLARGYVERGLAGLEEPNIQFERTGYFCLDPGTTNGGRVYNRTVPLVDSYRPT